MIETDMESLVKIIGLITSPDKSYQKEIQEKEKNIFTAAADLEKRIKQVANREKKEVIISIKKVDDYILQAMQQPNIKSIEKQYNVIFTFIQDPLLNEVIIEITNGGKRWN